jgi:hypothetical protein
MRWEEANRSLWPNSEVHEESLPAMPALLFSRVQNNHTTRGYGLGIWQVCWWYFGGSGTLNDRSHRVFCSS